MDELLVWLRATVEGDKAKAETAAVGGRSYWSAQDGGDSRGWWVDAGDGTPDGFFADREDWAAHVVRHDPRDTIARCEMELALLDRCERVINEVRGNDEDGMHYHPDARKLARITIRALASGYKHRPGFTEDWKP